MVEWTVEQKEKFMEIHEYINEFNEIISKISVNKSFVKMATIIVSYTPSYESFLYIQ